MKVKVISGLGHFLTLFFQVLYVLCFYQVQISGERLQDHWSSGYDIRVTTAERLRQIGLEQIGSNVWSTYFKDWELILRVLNCPDCVKPMIPGLSVSLSH